MCESMTIGQLARAAGVNVDTVRYYERTGLMPRPQRSAKTLGFKLEEVSRLLTLVETSGDRAEVRALAKRRLDEAVLEERQHKS